MENLKSVITEIKEKIENHSWYFFKNEQNVRSEIIDPILKQLGWKFPNLDREVSKGGKSPDYILSKENSVKFVIEAKEILGFDKEKDLIKSVEQLKEYCNNFQVSYGILTNGNLWLMYHFCNQKAILKSKVNLSLMEKEYIGFFKDICFENIDHLHKKYKIKPEEKISCKYQEKQMLKITFNDGKKFVSNNSGDNFAKAIKKIGVEKISNLQLRKTVISNSKKDIRPSARTGSGKHFISTDSSTLIKYFIIKELNDKLKLGMEVELVEKDSHINATAKNVKSKADKNVAKGNRNRKRQISCTFPDNIVISNLCFVDTYLEVIKKIIEVKGFELCKETFETKYYKDSTKVFYERQPNTLHKVLGNGYFLNTKFSIDDEIERIKFIDDKLNLDIEINEFFNI